MPRSRAKSKALPPPTRSEAAFERVLAQFDAVPKTDEVGESGAETIDEFVARLFAQQREFLARDEFAGVGERDSFPTKVMGVSFEGRQDLVAGLVPGNELELKRQPDNPVDANAIAVHYGNFQIGFLRKQIAKHLAPLIDGGVRYSARIEHITGGPSTGSGSAKHYGVNIRVERASTAAAPA